MSAAAKRQNRTPGSVRGLPGDRQSYLDEQRVSASTQNQAFSALLFLFHQAWLQQLGDLSKGVRAKDGRKLSVVLSLEVRRRRGAADVRFAGAGAGAAPGTGAGAGVTAVRGGDGRGGRARYWVGGGGGGVGGGACSFGSRSAAPQGQEVLAPGPFLGRVYAAPRSFSRLVSIMEV